MNVLITSAGRRTSLLRAFQKHAGQRGGRVLAADMDPLAPTLHLADGAATLPPLDDPTYMDRLLEVVCEHEIRLLVPTIDTELSLLAANADVLRGAGCMPLISSPGLVRITGDKALTMETFSARGIRTPRSWLPDSLAEAELPDRLFVKPRDGSASKHTYAVDRGALDDVLGRVPNAIVQEHVPGQEITIDALLDLQGRPLHYVPRERIRTLAGESIQGVTISDEPFRDWMLKLLGAVSDLGGIGPMTLQAFLTGEGDPVFSEINPRFGGGFPLAYAAGGEYPDWLLQMLEGKRLASRFGEYEVGLCMTRYYSEIFTGRPGETGGE